MAVLGSGINPLQADVLVLPAFSWRNQRFAEGDSALANANDAALKHEEVVLDFSVPWEATHRSNALLGLVVFGRSIVLDLLVTVLVVTLADAVDLLVHFGTVEVTLLTDASNGPGNTSRMPSSNTSDLAKTLVSLARQLASAPTGSDTLNTVALGHANGIKTLVW